MLDELAPWPGAEVLSDVFRALKGRAVASSGIPAAAEFERRVGSGVRELVCGAFWTTGELSDSLEIIERVLEGPDCGPRSDAARACEQVATWAREKGLPVTGFYFAAAAALCASGEARHAYLAGRLARDLAKWDVAEAWLEFAAAAARRGRDRETQVAAVLGLGNMFYRQGLYRRARETHLMGLELTRRYELPDHHGGALHDLFVMAVELRDGPAAEAYAREALHAYGASHPRVPALAHDVAYFWVTQGHYGRALPVLRALLPYLHSPDDRVRVLASAARAAGGIGRRAEYAELVHAVREVGRDPLGGVALAAGLVEAAQGALLLHGLMLAEELLTEAIRVARERGEVDVLARAEELRASKSAARPDAAHAPATGHQADELARDLVSSLRSDELADRLIRSTIARDVLKSAEEPLHPSAAELRPRGVEALTPYPAAQAHHTVFRRCAWSARIIEYASYSPSVSRSDVSSWEKVLHLQADGRPSFNRATRSDVPPPHVHDPSVPGGVRAACPDEIPRRPW